MVIKATKKNAQVYALILDVNYNLITKLILN